MHKFVFFFFFSNKSGHLTVWSDPSPVEFRPVHHSVRVSFTNECPAVQTSEAFWVILLSCDLWEWKETGESEISWQLGSPKVGRRRHLQAEKGTAETEETSFVNVINSNIVLELFYNYIFILMHRKVLLNFKNSFKFSSKLWVCVCVCEWMMAWLNNAAIN